MRLRKWIFQQPTLDHYYPSIGNSAWILAVSPLLGFLNFELGAYAIACLALLYTLHVDAMHGHYMRQIRSELVDSDADNSGGDEA